MMGAEGTGLRLQALMSAVLAAVESWLRESGRP
jgi:hypothetical protein